MLQNQTVAAIVVAAGASRRMGFDKLFHLLEGGTVLKKSLVAFDTHPLIDEIIVVAGANSARILPLLQHLHKPHTLVQGGATRAVSVQRGLAATQAQLVAIHDAARPFVRAETITAALAAAFTFGAAAPAVAVKDTIKQANADGTVRQTPPRETLFAVQTPQCFVRELYLKALTIVQNDAVTDDCSVLELAGFPVHLTQGDYGNYKITTREDLPAQAQTKGEKAMRIGHGYDVHKLVEGRALILGGVQIPYEKGLLGHSDADVLTHAVMDALLGAAALGDIGKLFPDTDAAYEGADSMLLLQKVGEKLAQNGYGIENIDATILCQRPKLAPHIDAMRTGIAAALCMDAAAVSVKATTEEGLGFTGAGAGIAAHSVCLIQKAL
ncbi:MAG: 2-C-methyl-D-erythritol 2,4-cyclodiphosphate synthase [Ruthenibacterium sp.]